jgi:hypothetical protein
VLFGHLFPWVLLLPPALFTAVREARRGNPTARMLLGLTGSALVVYAAVPTKLPWYLVPVYPAAALLVGRQLDRWLRGCGYRSAFWLAAVVAVALLSPRPVNPLNVPGADLAYTQQNLAAALAASRPLLVSVLLLFAAFAATALLVGRCARRWTLVALGCLSLALTALSLFPSVLNRSDSDVATLGRTAGRDQPATSAPLAIFPDDDLYPAALFYSDRPVVVATSADMLLGLSSAHAGLGLISRRDALPALVNCCLVTVLAEAGSHVYARVEPRS